MHGLGYSSIRELELLSHRVRRLYGVGRLPREGLDEIRGKIDELRALFDKYNDERDEELDATEESATGS